VAATTSSWLSSANFAEKGWQLWDEDWLRQRLEKMSRKGYENQVSAVVTKLLLRGKIGSADIGRINC
jgi:hypothetical protein